MYVTYKRIEAKILKDNSVQCVLFGKEFKSLKSFKRWAFIFSNKYLNYTTTKKEKETYLNYSNLSKDWKVLYS